MTHLDYTPHQRAAIIPFGPHTILGDLRRPAHAAGLVIFVHGRGSSRRSPRNRCVAQLLEADGFATLLIDLFTRREEQLHETEYLFRSDVGQLGRRVMAVIEWVRKSPWGTLPIGLFGANTGAAAALVAAAEQPLDVAAVVCRGGHGELAGPAIEGVTAPTLLLVGALDDPVIDTNVAVAHRLRGATTVRVIPGATHLFEEPGALDRVAELASEWFGRYLPLAPLWHSTQSHDASRL